MREDSSWRWTDQQGRRRCKTQGRRLRGAQVRQPPRMRRTEPDQFSASVPDRLIVILLARRRRPRFRWDPARATPSRPISASIHRRQSEYRPAPRFDHSRQGRFCAYGQRSRRHERIWTQSVTVDAGDQSRWCLRRRRRQERLHQARGVRRRGRIDGRSVGPRTFRGTVAVTSGMRLRLACSVAMSTGQAFERHQRRTGHRTHGGRSVKLCKGCRAVTSRADSRCPEHAGQSRRCLPGQLGE